LQTLTAEKIAAKKVQVCWFQWLNDRCWVKESLQLSLILCPKNVA
jgi:hypothetical protein